jgi:hypothetical protein
MYVLFLKKRVMCFPVALFLPVPGLGFCYRVFLLGGGKKLKKIGGRCYDEHER